jgi:hypothetical protein
MEMKKSGWMRWALDGALIVMLGYAGWSFSQFAELHESDIIQRAQITAVSQSVDRLDATLNKLNDSMEAQNEQLGALIILATYRTDPWSGRMMSQLQEDWFDILAPTIPGLKLAMLPDVVDIQKKYESELAPKGL